MKGAHWSWLVGRRGNNGNARQLRARMPTKPAGSNKPVNWLTDALSQPEAASRATVTRARLLFGESRRVGRKRLAAREFPLRAA